MAQILSACIDCGKSISRRAIRCKPCAMKKRWQDSSASMPFCRRGNLHHRWKGGRTTARYIFIRLSPDDFFYSMALKSGYVAEHRLVMAKHLNRCLLPWEVVHHRNGNREDNRIENLQLLPTQKYHMGDILLKRRVGRLEKQVSKQTERITLLEAENILLHKQIKGEMEVRYGQVDHQRV